MPFVKSTGPDIQDHLTLVQQGHVKKIAAHAPDDNGTSTPVILTELHAVGKVGKQGKLDIQDTL